MGLFDRFKKSVPYKEPEPVPTPVVEDKPKKPRKPRAEKPAEPKLKVKGKSPKDIATAKGEPYVSIVSVELDPENIGNGAFELDWNDIFVSKLVRAGYQGKTDADVVDNWFKTICRNVIMENFEQWEANQPEEMRPRAAHRSRFVRADAFQAPLPVPEAPLPEASTRADWYPCPSCPIGRPLVRRSASRLRPAD